MKKNKIGSLFTLAAYTGIIVHLMNRYVSIHSSHMDVLPTYHGRFFNAKLGRVYYSVKGKGAPLLLLHDISSGWSGYEWSRTVDELSKDYAVYTVDMPGCGRSDKANQIFTNFVFVQFLASFIKQVIGEKTNVIASGYSCSVVTMTNLYQEDLFEKIIFVNPDNVHALAKPVSSKGRLYFNILRTPVLGTFIYHLHVSKENITTCFVNQYFYNPFRVDRDLIDAYYESAHKGAYDCKFIYASKASGYMNVDIKNALKKLPKETLILRGEGEMGSSTDASYIEHCPSIQRIVLNETKHLPHIEKPEAFLEEVRRFLK